LRRLLSVEGSRKRLLSVEEKAAHRAPHEWEEWSTHDYFRSFDSVELPGRKFTGRHLLKTDPERRFYHHRATNQTQWHPPEGWDPAQARQHQRSSRAASRKLLQAGGGEGRLCKPSPAGEPSPGMQDDVLGLVPCPDDTMICEPLDPMFCPNVPNVCDDWDCKCYGPGKNDNTTITGVLGRTVIDGEKSSLSCGCGTESESGMAKSITSMPFEWKKNSKGELVMDYQCCDDYFDGYQCTMWDYSQTGSPVCLSMYDDHNMKKCAAEKCCSSYTEDLTRPYPGPWDDAAAGTTGPGPNSCVSPMTGLSLANNGWCDETECPPLSLRNHDMYGGGGFGGGFGYQCGTYECDAGTDTTDCENSCQYSYDFYCDEPYSCMPGTDTADCNPGGAGSGGGSGASGGIGGGGGQQCYGSGVFTGSFQPLRDEDAPEVEAQLLSKGGADRLFTTLSESSSGGSNVGATILRMNEKFVFKGTFLPDSSSTPHATAPMSDGSSSLSKSRPSAAPEISSPYAAYDDVVALASERAPPATMHALSLDSVGDQHVPQKPRDREARGNAPGAPGGKNDDYSPAPFLCAREPMPGS